MQRVGYGSFEPDNGVLIAKNKPFPPGGPSTEDNTCGFSASCFTWVEDAHPEDINQVDFVQPDGTKVMRTIGDYRQLNDALYHAGTNSGSQDQYTDGPNGLKIYVLDKYNDATGSCTTRSACRTRTAPARRPAASRSRPRPSRT